MAGVPHRAPSCGDTAAQEAHLLQRGGDIDLVRGRIRVRVRGRVAHLLERGGPTHLVRVREGVQHGKGLG